MAGRKLLNLRNRRAQYTPAALFLVLFTLLIAACTFVLCTVLLPKIGDLMPPATPSPSPSRSVPAAPSLSPSPTPSTPAEPAPQPDPQPHL